MHLLYQHHHLISLIFPYPGSVGASHNSPLMNEILRNVTWWKNTKNKIWKCKK